MPFQIDWRFCNKCNSMFYDGFPDKGHCPVGGGHAPMGFNFALSFDEAETEIAQTNWKFCNKCNSMFYDGFPDKGHCPVGEGHAAMGFNFTLPHDLPDLVTLDSGYLVTDEPLGGTVKLVINKNGDFTFSGSMHNSGFDNIKFVATAVAMTPSKIGYTVTHSGHTEGTSGGGLHPNRDDSWTQSGNNPSLRDNWEQVTRCVLEARVEPHDVLIDGIQDMLRDAAAAALRKLGEAGVIALIALL